MSGSMSQDEEPSRAGRVSLVGAGPGDPGLITLRGVELLGSADVILYDRLVDRRLLEHAGPDAQLVDAGKAPGERRLSQQDINDRLIAEARHGKMVVRLKGGDPFVLGRGGEEAEALAAEGIEFEVVPGVSSAVAAPAYAGIPLTHRGLSSAATIVTGSEDPDKDDPSVDWAALAKGGATLVVLMGFERLDAIAGTLVRHGRSPDTPVALVRWGTTPAQETVVGTLSDIASRASDAELSPPVVAVIGDVVRLRNKLRWFDKRPMFGKRVLVTRTREHAGELSRLLSARGAVPIELPTIRILPPDDFSSLDAAVSTLSMYDWVIFTSANAVSAVIDRMAALGLDGRAFHRSKVAVIGDATAGSLQARSITADLIPREFVAEALLEHLTGTIRPGDRVLLPKADKAREILPEGLRSLGAHVEEVTAYRTVEAKESRSRLSELLGEGIDVATFTSSSTVTSLAALLDYDAGRLADTIVACIGPVTAGTAGEMGMKVDIVAGEHTIGGLVDAVETYFREEGSIG